MKPFYFTKENGKVKGLWSELKDGTYKAVKPKYTRSPELNRLYWGWFLKHLVLFHEELWEVYTADQLHEAFKAALLKQRVNSQTGNKKRWVTIIGSTSTMTNKQMCDYMDKINKMYMDAHGYEVPDHQSEDDLIYWESLIV